MKDVPVASKTSDVKQISLVILRLEIDDININTFNDITEENNRTYLDCDKNHLTNQNSENIHEYINYCCKLI